MPGSTLVRDVMSTPVVTLRPDDKVEHAADVLAEKNVGSLPVVDDDGKLLGILRDDDLIASEARVHVPTFINFLGLGMAFPGRDEAPRARAEEDRGRDGARRHADRSADRLARRDARRRRDDHARPRRQQRSGRRRRRRRSSASSPAPTSSASSPGPPECGPLTWTRSGRCGPRSTSRRCARTCDRCARSSRRRRCARS